jgi:hypothetical protein
MGHPPVFIVGTGRCGSTLLSGFLRAHGQVLSLSEFFVFVTDFGGRIAEAFPSGELSGAEFWPLLAGAHPRQTLMLRNGVMMDEALYRPGPGRRFTLETGVPALVATTLTHLCAEPESLFDALQSDVEKLPPAPIGRQYLSFFNALRDRFRASIWVERSGGSLRLVQRLRQHFPEARFVHIVRDGRDTALSMSRHLGFRLALINAQLTEILGVDPFENPDRRFESDLPDELVPFLPERFEAETFRNFQTALPLNLPRFRGATATSGLLGGRAAHADIWRYSAHPEMGGFRRRGRTRHDPRMALPDECPRARVSQGVEDMTRVPIHRTEPGRANCPRTACRAHCGCDQRDREPRDRLQRGRWLPVLPDAVG